VNQRTNAIAILVGLSVVAGCQGTPPTCSECRSGCEVNSCRPGPEQVWTFVTNARLIPTNIKGREGADSKCLDMYQFAYSLRQCTNVRAVIQVSDNDLLAQMAFRYGVPETVPVKRANDTTMVATDWRDFINPNAQLLAAVNPTIGAPSFWSGMGNGVASNNYCEGWTSASHSQNGDSGDASRTRGWQYIGGVQYCDTAHRLLCACW
jgi:hypothetical protein